MRYDDQVVTGVFVQMLGHMARCARGLRPAATFASLAGAAPSCGPARFIPSCVKLRTAIHERLARIGCGMVFTCCFD